MDATIVRKGVLDLLARETPAAFWRAVTTRMKWAYGEGFEAVATDPRLLPNQKPAKLLEERFYLAERGLDDAARQAGLVSSGQVVPINGWVYTFVRSGSVCLLQSYVQTSSDFARPARFREQHAALNRFLSSPQLALGDIRPELFRIAAVAGILIHGPIGKKFDADNQRLGFLNFAVPTEDYQAWEVSIPVAEIALMYGNDAAEASTQRDIAVPTPRRDRKPNTGTEPA